MFGNPSYLWSSWGPVVCWKRRLIGVILTRDLLRRESALCSLCRFIFLQWKEIFTVSKHWNFLGTIQRLLLLLSEWAVTCEVVEVQLTVGRGGSSGSSWLEISSGAEVHCAVLAVSFFYSDSLKSCVDCIQLVQLQIRTNIYSTSPCRSRCYLNHKPL